MALDASHPNIVLHEGSLGLVTIPKPEAQSAVERHLEWQRTSARRQLSERRPLLIGGLLGAALLAGLGIFVWHLDGLDKYVLVVPAGFITGAILASLIVRPRAAPLAPVSPAPIQRIADEVITHAAADSTVSDIQRWSRAIWEYQNAVRLLPSVRASVARKEYELYISPGDRSTWYYDPAGLASLEAQFVSQRAAYESVAAELGFAPE